MKERSQLLAEKASLERMLARLPKTSVIDRMSLEARRSQVEEALAAAPAVVREAALARLTFRGKPILPFGDSGPWKTSELADRIGSTPLLLLVEDVRDYVRGRPAFLDYRGQEREAFDMACDDLRNRLLQWNQRRETGSREWSTDEAHRTLVYRVLEEAKFKGA